MKNKENLIRKSVSETYTRSVEGKSCCCKTGIDPKGVAAKSACYGPKELKSLPTGVVANSFGCGNPLAYSGIKEGQNVLDLGSGAGIDILLAGKKVGPGGSVIGIDMTDAMIKKANENIDKSKVTMAKAMKDKVWSAKFSGTKE